MSKRLRLLLILLLVGFGVVTIYPTVEWYFAVPQEMKQLASTSRVQIREYAVRQAREALGDLRVAAQADNPLPEEYSFLTDVAEENFRLQGEDLPERWSAEEVLSAFRTEGEAFDTLEQHYAEEIFALKDEKSHIIQLGLDLSGGMSVTLEADRESLAERLGEEPSDAEMDDAVDRAMEILTNRIDRFGVTEPVIRRQENNQILIEIPGDADPERVNSFLRGRGSLNFHIVHEEATERLIELQQNEPGWSPEMDDVPEWIPAGTEVVEYVTKDEYGIDQHARWIVIYEDIGEYGLGGSHLQDAQTARDPLTNQPVVNFVLDGEGADIFSRLTRDNVGSSLAIVMDEEVRAYARIQEEIPTGQVRISGFSQEEAQNIALVLRTAALPVDLVVLNQESIGASLGRQTIQAGLRSIGLGFALVVLFMLLYYKGAGLVADLALLLNLFFIVAVLSAFNLTLTLTSIAGIILTVGMAVDANVIIFERIKEEYRLGKSPRAAINAGFQKAFWTIMDANITTFIAAIFLSQLGTGPIQGFAVTLAVGIVSSMFTALFVSRLVFDFSTEVLKRSKLSIGWRIR
ncbi:MAG: protein translocase subunit SecD [Alkalispirochaetaceae bacterium]